MSLNMWLAAILPLYPRSKNCTQVLIKDYSKMLLNRASVSVKGSLWKVFVNVSGTCKFVGNLVRLFCYA